MQTLAVSLELVCDLALGRHLQDTLETEEQVYICVHTYIHVCVCVCVFVCVFVCVYLYRLYTDEQVLSDLPALYLVAYISVYII